MKDITSEWNEASAFVNNFRKRSDKLAETIKSKTFASQAALEAWVAKHPADASKLTLQVRPGKIQRNADGTIFLATETWKPEPKYLQGRKDIVRKLFKALLWGFAVGTVFLVLAWVIGCLLMLVK